MVVVACQSCAGICTLLYVVCCVSPLGCVLLVLVSGLLVSAVDVGTRQFVATVEKLGWHWSVGLACSWYYLFFVNKTR